MASEHKTANTWITKMESQLESKNQPTRKNLTVNTLLKTIERYNQLQGSDQTTKKRVKNLILETSKVIIERNQDTCKKALTSREGSKTRLRGIASYASQLSNLLEPVLLHINESDYARSIIEEFMPSVEEAARYATKLEPETAAHLVKILNTAEAVGLTFNKGLNEVFEEIIQIRITPKKLDVPQLLLDLAEKRFQAGEYLTSYLLSREATRTMLEDLTGAYTKDVEPDDMPTPDWRLEDYLGYLIEAGLISAEQGKEFLVLFVGEPEHLNNRWKNRREAEKALKEIKNYLEIIDAEDNTSDWL
jgi:hypothetical protein